MALTQNSTVNEGPRKAPQLVGSFLVPVTLHFVAATVGVGVGDLTGAERVFLAGATMGSALPSGYLYPTAGSSVGLGNTHGVIRFKVAVDGVITAGNQDALVPGNTTEAETAVKATLAGGDMPSGRFVGFGS